VLSELINAHEQEAMCCYLRCLFKLNSELERDNENRQKIAQERLITTCSIVVKSYMDCLRKLSFLTHRVRHTDYVPPPTKEEIWLKRLTESKIPVIILILNQFAQFREFQISTNLSFIYPLLCDLSLSDNFLVRKSLRDVLLRVGKIKLGELRYEVINIETSSLNTGELHNQPADLTDEEEKPIETVNGNTVGKSNDLNGNSRENHDTIGNGDGDLVKDAPEDHDQDRHNDEKISEKTDTKLLQMCIVNTALVHDLPVPMHVGGDDI